MCRTSWWWEPGRTGSPPPSRAPKRAARCSSSRAADTIGGGTRTAELTLPGFQHDVCSAIHPLAAVSPFFEAAGLERHGLELVHPEVALAHPLDDGRAGLLHRSLDATVAGLGVDGAAWDRNVGWTACRWPSLAPSLLGPILKVLPAARAPAVVRPDFTTTIGFFRPILRARRAKRRGFPKDSR